MYQPLKLNVVPGVWPPSVIERLLQETSKIKDTGGRIEYISRSFLGTPYQASTLTGTDEDDEVFVINLAAVDCFTFIDYIEAMRRSDSFMGFRENLLLTRYRYGQVTFRDRNHFFTDWRDYNGRFICDVTKEAGGGRALRVVKTLNRKKDGSPYIRGIPEKERDIDYIPSGIMDSGLSDRLQTGDYAGIYSEEPGLDVSHTGIIIRRDGELILRHASSSWKKVVDEDFKKYMAGRPGLIVLRPIEPVRGTGLCPAQAADIIP